MTRHLPGLCRLLALCIGGLAGPLCAQPEEAPRPQPKVLVVLSYHIGMPWADAVSRGIFEALDGRADTVVTQLDVKRHPPSGRDDQLLAVASAKADMSQPAVVVAIDDFAYEFVTRYRERLAPDAPLVFGGVNYFQGTPPARTTGVVESLNLADTLDLMDSLQPHARRWVIVNDLSETGVANRRALEQVLAERSVPHVVWLGSGTFAETEAELSRLDARTDAVLILSWNLDSSGATRSYEEAASRAREICPAPLYGVWSFYFGHGILGGALLDGQVHGREVGALVRRVLEGEQPESIAVVDQCRTSLRLDQRELDRFGIPSRLVPEGAEIAFAEPGLWQVHGRTLAAGAIIIALQSLTISWLLLMRRHRKLALERLKESESQVRLTLERLETAQEQALIGSWDLDPATARTQWSKQMFRLFGLDPSSQPPGRDEVLGMFHPADRPRAAAALRDAAEKRTSSTIELRSDPLNGPMRTFRATIQVRPDSPREAPLVGGTLQDITAQAQAEAQARESQERMALALQGADLGIWDWHIPSGEVTFSERCAAMLGYQREEIDSRARLWASLLHPDDLPHVQATLHAYMHRRAVSHEIEVRLRHKAGSWVWVLTKGKLITQGPAGEPLLAAGTHLDITERKQREEALRSSERKLAEIFRSSPEVICLTRAENGRFIEVNDAFTQVFGYTSAEVAHQSSLDLRMWPSPAARADVVSHILEHGELRNRELSLHAKSGRLVPVLASAALIVLEGESCLIWLITDITERKRAEQEHASLQEQLLHAMKMEAVGRLAGGVAHDFNNLLTVISGNTELARRDLGRDHPQGPLLEEVALAASSAAGLTRQLLAFSRRQIIEPRLVDLNDLIENLRKILLRLIGEDVVLQTHLASGLGTVRIDPGQFEQVIINLAVNARDAMPGGGCLTISTSTSDLDAAACARHPGATPGRYAMLTVTDTGHGMTPDVKERLFEPFFTTKPVGRGTGLGLAMTFGAVQQARGVIEVDSEPGRGTAFRICLPLAEGTAPASPPTRSDALARGTETILVVEDDASVRAFTTKLLSRLGYRVLSAPDGLEAIALARTLTIPLDLLLTDLVMPGLSGRETAGRILELHPQAAVLYASGYTEDMILRQGILSKSVAFLSKPYTLEQIASKVRSTLDTRTRLPRAATDA